MWLLSRAVQDEFAPAAMFPSPPYCPHPQKAATKVVRKMSVSVEVSLRVAQERRFSLRSSTNTCSNPNTCQSSPPHSWHCHLVLRMPCRPPLRAGSEARQPHRQSIIWFDSRLGTVAPSKPCPPIFPPSMPAPDCIPTHSAKSFWYYRNRTHKHPTSILDTD